MMWFKRILILRPDNIGDSVLFSGSLKHYRNLYPDAKITLAVKKHIIPLFKYCPFIDSLIDYKELSYVKDSKTKVGKFFNKVRKLVSPIIINDKQKYDIVICPVRSVTLEMLWTVKNYALTETIGIEGDLTNIPPKKQYLISGVFKKYFIITKDKIWQHDLKTNMDFLNFLGAELKSVEEIWPEFWIDYKGKFDELNSGLVPSNYCLLFPFTTREIKNLTEDGYVKIIKKLDMYDNIIISGTLEDYDRAERLKEKLNSLCRNVINLCGKTSLNDMILLINGAREVISSDSAPLHIAIALKKKTYATVGGGQWGRFFPWDNIKNVNWLNKKMDCFQCNWNCKYDDYRCVSNIDYENIR